MTRTTPTTLNTLSTVVTTGLLASLTLASPPTYEDLPIGTTYVVGDSDSSTGVPFRFDCFRWASGDVFCGGIARIDPQIPGCNSGRRMLLNNINVQYDYLGSIGAQTNPVFAFGEYGGNINLAINGDTRNFANFLDIDGTVVGGCTVRVLSGGGGNDCGRIMFEGVVNRMTVGGQEFWWDGTPDCDISFEGLPLGSVYPAVASLTVAGVPTTIRELLNPTTPPTFGEAVVGDAGFACGEDHELWTNNCRAKFDFEAGPGAVRNLSVQFGEYGGHINVAINGDLAVVPNFIDLPSTLGGVAITIVSGGTGGDCGEMLLSGVVKEFEIGGQELWIDCLQYETDPDGGDGGDDFECEDALIDHADLPFPATWSVGDTLITNGVKVSIFDFMSSSGPFFGSALSSEARLACGDDLELATYNTHATYDFAGSIGSLVNATVQVSDQAGEVNLGVDGLPVLVARDYIDLDGVVIGGVTIRVEAGGHDGDCTTLRLEGTLDHLTLGGQQHFIDCIWAEQVIAPGIPGDLNGDGCVDSADVGVLLGHWGTPQSDLNGDGTTDAADFGMLLGNWGC